MGSTESNLAPALAPIESKESRLQREIRNCLCHRGWPFSFGDSNVGAFFVEWCCTEILTRGRGPVILGQDQSQDVVMDHPALNRIQVTSHNIEDRLYVVRWLLHVPQPHSISICPLCSFVSDEANCYKLSLFLNVQWNLRIGPWPTLFCWLAEQLDNPRAQSLSIALAENHSNVIFSVAPMEDVSTLVKYWYDHSHFSHRSKQTMKAIIKHLPLAVRLDGRHFDTILTMTNYHAIQACTVNVLETFFQVFDCFLECCGYESNLLLDIRSTRAILKQWIETYSMFVREREELLKIQGKLESKITDLCSQVRARATGLQNCLDFPFVLIVLVQSYEHYPQFVKQLYSIT